MFPVVVLVQVPCFKESKQERSGLINPIFIAVLEKISTRQAIGKETSYSKPETNDPFTRTNEPLSKAMPLLKERTRTNELIHNSIRYEPFQSCPVPFRYFTVLSVREMITLSMCKRTARQPIKHKQIHTCYFSATQERPGQLPRVFRGGSI